MRFTDAELKTLSEDCRKDFTGIWPHQKDAVLRLIARLEAAENVLELIRGGESPRHALVQDGVQAWRKSAGRVQE